MLTGDLGDDLLSILFASSEPVTVEQLSLVFPAKSPEAIERELTQLAEQFNDFQNAVAIQKVAGGFRIITRPERHEVIREFLKTKPSAKLSPAALETLAVIAYRQPVTMPEIMEIRGVKGSSTVKTLLEKRLIEIRGRKKVVGRPILYATTREFLVHFGLNDLSDLPSLEEFEELIKAESEPSQGPVSNVS